MSLDEYDNKPEHMLVQHKIKYKKYINDSKYLITIEQAKNLKVNDNVDIRDKAGAYCLATITNTNVQGQDLVFYIHYNGWCNKYDEEIDYVYNTNRFALPNTLSTSASRKFKKFDIVDVCLHNFYKYNSCERNCQDYETDKWVKGTVLEVCDKYMGYIRVSPSVKTHTERSILVHSNDYDVVMPGGYYTLTIPMEMAVEHVFNIRKMESNDCIVWISNTIDRVPCISGYFYGGASDEMIQIVSTNIKYHNNRGINIACSLNTLYALRNWFMGKVVLDRRCYLNFNTLCELYEISHLWCLPGLTQYCNYILLRLLKHPKHPHKSGYHVLAPLVFKFSATHQHYDSVMKLILDYMGNTKFNGKSFHYDIQQPCSCLSCMRNDS